MNKTIQGILTTRRSHGSAGELAFLSSLHERIKTLGFSPRVMAEGCVVVEVGEKSKTLFSCHTDTVHSLLESNGQKQTLVFDENMGHIFLEDKTAGCLGADDGAGIYILLTMIEAKVAGTYIFHRGEEKGGIGSRAMVAKHPEWAEEFDRCIAFDRQDNFEVICTQGGHPCASVTFGKALSAALNAADTTFSYEVSHKGSFTDSKVYNYLIPECVNVGVGYQHQHSNAEYLDWAHLQALTAACLKIDWEALPTDRICPLEPVAKQQSFDNFMHYPQGKVYQPKAASKLTPVLKAPAVVDDPEYPDVDFVMDSTYDELLDMVGDASLVTTLLQLRLRIVKAEAAVATMETILGL